MPLDTALRLGVAFTPDLPPERLHDVARAAEASGLDDLWVWEDCFKESGIAAASAALAWTQRITVGIGLLPAPLRTVALTAMEFATLERMFPGRLVAGVGHGVQSWMGQAGVRVDSPLTLLREYTTALRRLLAGEEVTDQGRYVQLDRVRLDWPPAAPPGLFLGGAGPNSLALTGEIGDGSLLGNALTPDEVDSTCALVLKAARAEPGAHPIVLTVIAATGAEAQERVDREIQQWGASPGHHVGVAGSAARIADYLEALHESGVTTVVIQATADEPDLEGFVAFLGGQVRPLLSRGR